MSNIRRSLLRIFVLAWTALSLGVVTQDWSTKDIVTVSLLSAIVFVP